MSTRNLDLDLNFPTDIPDLPPPWPSTEVAIEWWLERARFFPDPAALERQLASSHREHFDAPFIMR